MSKVLLLPLSILAVALLGACGSKQPAQVVVVPPAQVVTQPPAQVVTQPPVHVVTPPPAATTPVVVAAVLRPGFGRIESRSVVPTAASAGGTAPTTMQRLNIRMDDGSIQVIDTPSPGFAIGDRVELTREGYIRRHPQS